MNSKKRKRNRKRNISNELRLSGVNDCEYKKTKKSKQADENSNKPSKPTDKNTVTEEYATWIRINKIMKHIKEGRPIDLNSADEVQKPKKSVYSLENYVNTFIKMIDDLEYIHIDIDGQEDEKPFFFIYTKEKKEKDIKEELPNIDNIDNVFEDIELTGVKKK